MKKLITFTLSILTIIALQNESFPRSWSDLNEGEREIYGSEREEKFPIRTLFMEMERWDNHYSFMLLWLYKYTDYPKYKSTRMLPFYYNLSSKIDNRERTVLPPLLTWLERDGTEETSYIAYPLYRSRIDTNGGDRSILFLLRWGSSDYSHSTDSYQTLIPLFYHSTDITHSSSKKESVWINPLFISWNSTAPDRRDDHTWWAPIIPLTFHNTDRYGGHRNILWLMDYSWDTYNGEDSLKRFWLLPLFAWKRGSEGYTSILPPLYINSRSGDEYHVHLFPLFARWRTDEYNRIYRKIITPVYASGSVSDSKSGEEISSSRWFPIIPLYYKSSDKNNGTHTNLLWIFDWARDKNGELTRFWFIPFVFYKPDSDESGYRFYPPFYFRPEGNTADEGYSMGIFHYKSWSDTEKTTWSWPYYHSETLSSKSGEGTETVYEKSFYTHFLPIYWSWENSSSRGTLILPLYFSYKNSSTTIHVNLTGYARKTYQGPMNPDITLGLGKKEDTWYLDSDVSWLYDVWSVSTRVPVKNPLKGKRKNSVNNLQNEKNSTDSAISKKKSVSRENAEYYWGWKLFFGWMAYEQADSRRHFRLLPLSWFTWDRESTDKMYVFLPFFLSYKSEADDQSYFLVAPFYGSQKQGDSYSRGVLINLYWDEYDAPEQYREQTVLWPFINWYNSPSKSGFRIFPLFWHRKWHEENTIVSRNFSLIHYSRSERGIDSGEITYRRRINPAYLLKEKISEKNSEYSLFAPIIPLFYYNETENRYSRESSSDKTVISPLWYYNSETWTDDKSTTVSSRLLLPLLPVFYRSTSNDYTHWNLLAVLDRAKSNEYSRFFFFPFYYYENDRSIEKLVSLENQGTDNVAISIKEKTGSIKTITPLHYYKSNTLTAGNDKEVTTRFWAPIIPIFYRSTRGDYTHWNFLGILDRARETGYSRFFLFPLFYTSREKGESHYNILGLIDWQNSSSGKLDYSFFLPFYYYKSGLNSTLIIPPLLTYRSNDDDDSKTRFYAGLYLFDSSYHQRRNLLYLYDHNRYIKPGETRDDYSLLLGSFKYNISPEVKEMQMLWGTLYSGMRYTNGDYSHSSLLWLAGISRKGNEFHSRILPLYAYCSDDDEWSLLMPLLLTYFSEDKSGDFDLGVLGLAYYRNNDIPSGNDRRMLLLGSIYNEVKRPERGYHEMGSLWGILWSYEKEEETGFRKFSILKGIYKWVEKDGEKDHSVLWVF